MNAKLLALLSVLSLLPSARFWAVALLPPRSRFRGGGVGGSAHRGGDRAQQRPDCGGSLDRRCGRRRRRRVGDSVDTDIARNNAVYEQRLARQSSQAVSVQDVIAMTQARLSDSVIATHVRTLRGCGAATSE